MFGFFMRAVLAASLFAGAAVADDARQILETARAKQLERWQGVDAYVVTQSTLGTRSSVWFVRTEVEADGGGVETVFLPRAEVDVQSQTCGGQMTPEALEAYAAGAEMTGDAVGSEIENGLEQAGLPRGLLAATGTDPWNTMDPRVMMGGGAGFLRAAAAGQRERAAYDPTADATETLDHLSSFLDRAELVGTETVEGRPAYHLRADDVDQVQKADGQEYRMESVSLYVDTEAYVPLLMRVDGTMVAGQESRPMTLENLTTDYRNVPGSNLYESYRQVMSMTGIMTDEQKAQMREAEAQIAEMEKQLADMPPDQRRMMENMMGPQLQMIRDMAQGGGFRLEVAVDEIRVNPDPADVFASTCAAAPTATVVDAGSAPDPTVGEADLRAAQQACLEQKMAEAQAAQKKKRGFGRLMSGVSRVASRMGQGDIARHTRDVYEANATADDLAQAAKDLGLTEDDIAACSNPG